MSPPDPRVPASYDEIVRRTVPDPDTSMRPTAEQEQQAREGFRAIDADEQALQDRITDELALAHVDLSGVTIEIDRTTAMLHGHAADVDAIRQIETAVSRVDGVSSVQNRLVVKA
ncbi:MAG: BON domain-containing protein [Myxococcota bacterium]|nr:BON domain-containing protein [Myxococcota bacterium]